MSITLTKTEAKDTRASDWGYALINVFPLWAEGKAGNPTGF